jgi:hypothetical protein
MTGTRLRRAAGQAAVVGIVLNCAFFDRDTKHHKSNPTASGWGILGIFIDTFKVFEWRSEVEANL